MTEYMGDTLSQPFYFCLFTFYFCRFSPVRF